MEEPKPIWQFVTEVLRARAVNGTVWIEHSCSTWGVRRIVHAGEKPLKAKIACTDPERFRGPAEPRIQAVGKAFARAIERSSETKLHKRQRRREIGKDKWAKRVGHCLAYPCLASGIHGCGRRRLDGGRPASFCALPKMMVGEVESLRRFSLLRLW
jgi:hypothetical protein